jgi:hypothetical protein
MSKKSLTLKDSYEDYDNIHQVEYNVYRKVCEEYNKEVVKHIIENAYEYKLPKRLGSIRIRKIKSKLISGGPKRIDWKLTKEYGKKIYHLNMHTDGYYYRWMWHKKTALFTNKSAYSYTPMRKDKRRMAKLLKDNVIDFFS